MRKKLLLILAIVLVSSIVFSIVAYGAYVSQVKIKSSGTIKVIPTPSPAASQAGVTQGVKVYGENYPTELTNINWGEVEAGAINYKRIFVTNWGDKPVTLALTVSNWTPGVNAKITWNYDGKAILPNAGATAMIVLTLNIESANVNTFSNEILITATEA